MSSEPTDTAITTEADAAATDGTDVADVVVEEILVEEVSIDGMCGVY